MDKQAVFKDNYLPYINRWGKITNWVGLVLAFGPALVLAVIFKIVPPVSAIVTGTVGISLALGVNWFIEPISYFPIIGVAGTYMAFVSGNISNLRIPCAAIAQKVAEVEPGTEEGTVISTLGIATSVIVNIVILALGVFAGQAILAQLPPVVTNALNTLMLPALFGALFVQFAMARPKLAPVALGIGIILNLTSLPAYLITLIAIFGTAAIALFMYKKKWL